MNQPHDQTNQDSFHRSQINAGADCSGLRLSVLELSHRYLQSINLSRSRLEFVNLAGSDLRGAVFTDTLFRSSALADADLRGSDLTRTEFRFTNLRGADLRGAVLKQTVFPASMYMESARFTQDQVFWARLSGMLTEEHLACLIIQDS